MTTDAIQTPAVDEDQELLDALLKQYFDAAPGRRLEMSYAKTNADMPGAGGPYEWAVDFHNAGAKYRYRAIVAGNRCGKTYSAAAEVACHLTGIYPEWWKGHRFTKPINAWVCGTTNQDVRDIQQYELFGKIGE